MSGSVLLSRVRRIARLKPSAVFVWAVRRIPGGRKMARRIAGGRVRTGRYSPFKAGRYMLPTRAAGLPAVVFVAVEWDPSGYEDLPRALEVAQLASGSYRTVVVTDAENFGQYRDRHLVVEHVMPRAVFDAVNPDDWWPEYLSRRVSSISDEYGASSVVPLLAPPGAVSDYLLRLAGVPK